MKKRLQARLQIAKFLQDAVDEMGKKKKLQESKLDFKEFMKKVKIFF